MSFHGGNIREAAEKYRLDGKSVIDFSASINPLGLPRNFKKNISTALKDITHYPDPDCNIIKENLSRYLNIPRGNILTGNGSIELIFLINLALKPKKALIIIPTFSEYERSVRLAGGECVFWEAYGENFDSLNFTRKLNSLSRRDIVFICNPNNPTGFIFEKKEIQFLAKECAKRELFLVIDEVFIDFVEEKENFSMFKAVPGNKYLLVLGSLTKFFALAGLRLGFLVGEQNLIKKISLFQPPWSVNSLAQAAGVFVLSDNFFIEKSRKYLFKQRKGLFAELKKIKGIQPYPPSANFIFCKLLTNRINSIQLRDYCGKRGILIRDCSDFRGLNKRFFRVAVRKKSENRELIKTLKQILSH